MRVVVLVSVLIGLLFSARVEQRVWPANRTFPAYLNEQNASALLRTITAQDMEYVTEIQAGETYYELRDHGQLLQALIPLGNEMQIQIVNRGEQGYRFDIVPIVFHRIKDEVSFAVGKGYAGQINRLIGSARLGLALGRLFGKAVNFRTLQPQDRFAFTYTQNARLGKPFGRPRILSALLKTHGKEHFVYVDTKGHAYSGTSKTVTYTKTEKRPFTYTTVRKAPSARFRMPVDHPRITSRFSYRRWHPILHKYRPHFGVDFGARRGTPLHAVNDGRIVYAGWMRGYGKVVKINHGSGFVSLYAHQSKILVKMGQHVKRGQVIGKVGSTGRSTGPHLHFGLYLRGKPVDPLHYIARKGTGKPRTIVQKHTVMKDYRVAHNKQVVIPGAKQAKRHLESLIKRSTPPAWRWLRFQRNFIDVHEIPGEKHTRPEVHHG